MTGPPNDTPPEIEALIAEGFRRMPAWRKLELVDDLRRTAMTLALCGIKERHPNESPAEQRQRLADLILGPELAAAVYGVQDHDS